MSEDRLFLGRGDIIIGVVVSAEIAYSKEGNRKYIRCRADISPADQEVTCTVSKMLYTSMAIREDWDTSEEAEKDNVQKLVGRLFEVKVDHIVNKIDGKTYIGLALLKEYW